MNISDSSGPKVGSELPESGDSFFVSGIAPSAMRPMYLPEFSMLGIKQLVCPLCFGEAAKKKAFWCAACLPQKKSEGSSINLELIQKQLKELRQRKVELQNNIANAMESGRISNRVANEQLLMQLSVLKTKVARLQRKNRDKSDRLNFLRRTAKDDRIRCDRHAEKEEAARQSMSYLAVKLADASPTRSRRTSSSVLETLDAAQRRVLLDLLQCVFPIDQVEASAAVLTTDSDSESEAGDSSSSVAAKLAEAMRWTDIGGQWVEQNRRRDVSSLMPAPNCSTGCHGFRIGLVPIYPLVGDGCIPYSPFAPDANTPGSSTTILPDSPGILVTALASRDLAIGYSYLNQLCLCLASVFQVLVPFPLSVFHKDVLAGRLLAEQFRLYCARVCANILHVCLAAGLEPTKLSPLNPSANLCQLIQHLRVVSESGSCRQQVNGGQRMVLSNPSEMHVLDSSLDAAESLLAGVTYSIGYSDHIIGGSGGGGDDVVEIDDWDFPASPNSGSITDLRVDPSSTYVDACRTSMLQSTSQNSLRSAVSVVSSFFFGMSSQQQNQQ